jgi:hypothetical protein
MKKILLLEDNPLDADLVCRGILTKWPAVEMVVVNRLAEAKQILTKDSSIELAIFDLSLPDGNGLDLLSELRASDNQIPIIILTGSGSEEIAIAALKAGASNYISKKPGFHEIIPEQIEFAINHNLKNKKHLSVLYIEHQKSDFDLTNLYLKKHAPFINLKQVSTGEEGLKLLPKNINLPTKYDALLLDYRLPGLNALEITKTIRLERKLNIPIVIVTGQGDENTAVEALKIGVDDYIVKRENYLIRLPFVLINAYRNRELEQQQQALKLSETKFRLLADFAADWEFWVDPMGEYIYTSPSCEKICGYPPEAFVKNKNLLTEITNPDYRAVIAKHFTQEEKELHKPIEFLIHAANREEKWISHYCRPVYDDNNNYLGKRGVNHDITERKRVELIQHVILNISNAALNAENLGDLMQVIQKELGLLVDTRNFFVALYNEENDTLHLPYYRDDMDDVVDFPAGKTLTGLVVKEGRSMLIKDADARKLENEEKIEKVGFDSEIWLGVPLKIKGKITGAFVLQSYTNPNAYNEKDKEILEIISHQISISIERKRNEERLLIALEAAQQSDRLKSAFLANMSHEIRTPMNGILGFSELLKQPNLSIDKQVKFIDIIEKSGLRMLSTINDIVDISKIEAGQMRVYISEVNINQKIEELYAFFKPEAEKKGLKLWIKNNLSARDSIIKSDKVKIDAILTNLIKNAIKFSNEGSIEIGCNKMDDYIAFYVKDTGIGIPGDRQQSVFERFVQADIEDKAVHEGSGLGLAISKYYVEMLNGEIWVESLEGKGSQFYFTIPYNTVKEKKPNQLNNKLKILIVEDDEAARIYLSEILEHLSDEISIAESGEKALEILNINAGINLILMDLKLPRISGFELTREIRKTNQDVVIIAQTAYSFAGYREKAIQEGCNDYISKPIDRELLLEIIEGQFKNIKTKNS